VSVLLVSLDGIKFPHGFKLVFECTNNVVEYEALSLDLETTEKMGIKQHKIFGDSDLVVGQVRENCQNRHMILRHCKYMMWDMFDNFFDAINVVVVAREMNNKADNLAKYTLSFFPPNLNHLSYSIKIMHGAIVRDNIKQWQVFEDDK
jgi:ribonuclease HI